MTYLILALITLIASFGLVAHTTLIMLRGKPNVLTFGLTSAMSLLMLGVGSLADKVALGMATPHSVVVALGFLLAMAYTDWAVVRLSTNTNHRPATTNQRLMTNR